MSYTRSCTSLSNKCRGPLSITDSVARCAFHQNDWELSDQHPANAAVLRRAARKAARISDTTSATGEGSTDD